MKMRMHLCMSLWIWKWKQCEMWWCEMKRKWECNHAWVWCDMNSIWVCIQKWKQWESNDVVNEKHVCKYDLINDMYDKWCAMKWDCEYVNERYWGGIINMCAEIICDNKYLWIEMDW